MTGPIEPVTLRTGDLVLRAPRETDVPEIVAICRDPEVPRWIPFVPAPYGPADARRWLGVAAAGREAATRLDWVVTDAAGGAVLGVVTLVRLDEAFPEVGYYAGPAARGRGVTTAAVRAACRWGLERGAPKVLWIARVGNEPSWRVAHRAGFRWEGRRLAEVATREGGRADAWAGSLLPGGLDAEPAPWPYDPLPALVDGPVSLRRWVRADAEAWLALESEPSTARWAGGAVDLDLEQVRERLDVLFVEDWLLGRQARLAVCADGVVVGQVALRTPMLAYGEGTASWALAEAVRGRGYGTRAVGLLVRWAFGHVGLDRVSAGTHVDNLASQALAERVGFRREGVLRGSAPAPGGGKGDDVAWGLLAGDLR